MLFILKANFLCQNIIFQELSLYFQAILSNFIFHHIFTFTVLELPFLPQFFSLNYFC